MTGRSESAGQAKAALALRKAQETQADPATPANAARRSGAEANRRKADAFVEAVLPAIEQARAQGNESCNAIAWTLNRQGLRTARNGAWTGAAVRAVLARAERLGHEGD
ncbi:MAG: hypothetical protein KGN34_13440 [Sphingomonadales bacterium]|nr:hypothetical protein [Sphingomonadales bacterium]